MVDSCPNGRQVGREDDTKPALSIKAGEQAALNTDIEKEDSVKSGLLCYPPCRAGYSGFGPFCWTDCPPGFKDIPLICNKPAGHKPNKAG